MQSDEPDRDAGHKSQHRLDPAAAASAAERAQHVRPCIDTASHLSKYRQIFTLAFATLVTRLGE